MKTPAFALAVVLIGGVAFAQGTGTRVPAQKPCGATGEIVALNHKGDDNSIDIKDLNGETSNFLVDVRALPAFYVKFEVGDRVTVSCKRYPEIGYLVYDIREAEK